MVDRLDDFIKSAQATEATSITVDDLKASFARAHSAYSAPDLLMVHPRTYTAYWYSRDRFKGWPRKIIFWPRIDKLETRLRRLVARVKRTRRGIWNALRDNYYDYY